MLTDSEIKQFQKAYEEDFGEKISKEEAEEIGARMVRLFEAVFKPKNEIKRSENYLRHKNYEIYKSKI